MTDPRPASYSTTRRAELPVLKTPMQISVFILGAALGLAISLLATVIPLRLTKSARLQSPRRP